jgi:MSHA biogenesis protein MshQ
VASAGGTFSSTITAALWTVNGDTDLTDNPVAPSYAGTVTLGAVLAAPMGGSTGVLGTLSATLAAGTKTIAAQSWTQSGALRISVSGTYLLQTVTGQNSAVLGRFSPASFKTVFPPPVCAAPIAFTYSGQAITTVTVTAMDGAATPAVTPNYAGAFARLVTLTDGSVPAAAGAFTANTIAATSFAAGTATNAPVYTFTVPTTAPAILSLRASDGEATSSLVTEAPALIRSGRLRLQNVFGSELLALSMPVEAQYWQGSYFVRNTDDNCTALAVPAATTLTGSATPNGLANLYFYPIVAGKNQLAIANTTVTLATPILANGVDQLLLTRPGTGHSGWLDIILATPSYLLGNWGNCMGQAGAAGLWDDQPCARATFGIYRAPLIYRRENY